jgi:glycosyltransferase involved in cell wall biosynthesis
MNVRISVVISTHNPDIHRLERTLRAVTAQTLDAELWELVLVDNASTKPVRIDKIPWSRGERRQIREEKLGLIYGRLAGIRASKGGLLVFVDDDNELAPDYLQAAMAVFDDREALGIAGGVMEPEWCDAEPETWASEFVDGFARRNFGTTSRVASKMICPSGLPEFSPMGAGMVARRAALTSWVAQAEFSTVTGRRGAELASCEDTDMVLMAFASGWSIGYFPELRLRHLIPAHRLHANYLARLYHDHNKCWVELLYKHGICPSAPAAPWTVALRKVRAYVRCRAWAGPAEYVNWRRACGHFEGRAAIYRLSRTGK